MKCVRMCALFELILTFFFCCVRFHALLFLSIFDVRVTFLIHKRKRNKIVTILFSNIVLFASISLIILYATHTYALRHFSSFSSRRVCFFRSLKEHFVVLTRKKPKPIYEIVQYHIDREINAYLKRMWWTNGVCIFFDYYDFRTHHIKTENKTNAFSNAFTQTKQIVERFQRRKKLQFINDLQF